MQECPKVVEVPVADNRCMVGDRTPAVVSECFCNTLPASAPLKAVLC